MELSPIICQKQILFTQLCLHMRTVTIEHIRVVAGLKLEGAISRKVLINTHYPLPPYIVYMAHACKKKGPF